MAKSGCSSIAKAILEEDIETIKRLLCKRKQIVIPDDLGQTPLFIATRKQNLNIVTLLLNASHVDVNHRDLKGFTSLHTLCNTVEPNLELAQLLLSHGADVNISSNEKMTPLHSACKNRHAALASLLIENGADLNSQEEVNNNTPLHCAIEADSAEIIMLLLDSGANTAKNNSQNFNPLMSAMLLKHSCVDVILAKTENINTHAVNGWTPLYYAIDNNDLNMVKALLDRGADVYCYANDFSPFTIALCIDNFKIFHLLWSYTDHDIISSDSKFLYQLCQYCLIETQSAYFHLIMKTPDVKFSIVFVSEYLKYLLRFNGTVDYKTVKQNYYDIIDWVLSCSQNRLFFSCPSFLANFVKSPYKLDILRHLLDKMKPHISLDTMKFSFGTDLNLAIILIEYCVNFPPEYFYITISSYPNKFEMLQYLLRMFTPSPFCKEYLIRTLKKEDNMISITNHLEQKVGCKRLTELCRDAIIEDFVFNSRTVAEIKHKVESAEIPQTLKELLRYQLFVNRLN